MTTPPNHPTVLVHDPAEEMFPGVLHPDAALFSDYMDVGGAAREHANMRRVLTECGYRVRTVREVLLEGTLDEENRPLRGAPLDSLRNFASRSLEFEPEGPIDICRQEQYREELLCKAHPRDLVRTILTRPVISLWPTPQNTKFAAHYRINPMMNLMYMRDPLIVTARGVVTGRFQSPQRTGEISVTEHCLAKMAIRPILKMEGDDHLEGGDYMLLGDTSFICHGMRTNAGAVRTLFENDAFGTQTVVVVKDRLHHQPQMHLDTHLGLVAPGLAFMAANRFHAKPGERAHLAADVYSMRADGSYAIVHEDIALTDYLRGAGFDIVPVSAEDSIGFGTNFLEVGHREIIAVDGKSEEYRAAMKRHGIRVHWLDLTECIKGYGAVHCLTQVFR